MVERPLLEEAEEVGLLRRGATQALKAALLTSLWQLVQQTAEAPPLGLGVSGDAGAGAGARPMRWAGGALAALVSTSAQALQMVLTKQVLTQQRLGKAAVFYLLALLSVAVLFPLFLVIDVWRLQQVRQRQPSTPPSSPPSNLPRSPPTYPDLPRPTPYRPRTNPTPPPLPASARPTTRPSPCALSPYLRSTASAASSTSTQAI